MQRYDSSETTWDDSGRWRDRDGINGAVSLARGNYAEAAMSFAAMIPMAGSAATVTKWGKKLVDKADKVATAAKSL